MHTRYTLLLVALAGLAFPTNLQAQCPAGEVSVEIHVETDNYGNETYWQLVPTGNGCGNGTLASGGNPALNCSSGGTQSSPAGGYGNNTTVVNGPWCLTEGAVYDIVAIDSYGDDQATYKVFVEGGLVGTFNAPGGFQVWTFTALPVQPYDMGISKLTTALYNETGLGVTVRGQLFNHGSETITSFTLNYRIDGGEVISEDVTGISLEAGTGMDFEHGTAWMPMNEGSVLLEVWATDLNGQEDQAPGNDLRSAQLVVNPAVPDIMDEYLAAPPILTVVADDDEDLLVPRDLDFHPDRTRNELWVINKDVAASGGSTVRFFNPGTPEQTFLWQRDPNAWHFMSLPTAIAMADNGNFATSPGVFDANHNGGTPFTGPTLWSADPAIYAQPLFGPLGSHLDMLHVNPNSQGIAHDHWNRYWVVDGFNGDIVMNDFREDHTPGMSYHGDALIRRYAEFTITRDPNDHIVSHAVMDKATGWLYVVDHGGRRILRMDTRSGTVNGTPTFGPWESYVEYSMVTGYAWEEIVSEGLSQPAGIDVIGDHLLVSDHATGDIVIYDKSGATVVELGRISTGAAGIMGIKVGPDGRIWYVNATTHALVRVDPALITSVTDAPASSTLRIHPNPASDRIFLSLTDGQLPPTTSVEVLDGTGRIFLRQQGLATMSGLDISMLANGTYVLRMEGHPAQRFTVAR
jgi:hypothetical protein